MNRFVALFVFVFVSALVIGCSSARHAHSAESLELKASLSGYNLLWPTARCCAFDLVLSTSGKGTVTIHDKRGPSPGDRVVPLMLSSVEIDALRQLILSNDFFSLPDLVGELPVDGDERLLDIRIGKRTKRVVFCGWAITKDQLNSYSGSNRDRLKRAGEVWAAIRALVSYDGLTLP